VKLYNFIILLLIHLFFLHYHLSATIEYRAQLNRQLLHLLAPVPPIRLRQSV
jgi:hypothetical protein